MTAPDLSSRLLAAITEMEENLGATRPFLLPLCTAHQEIVKLHQQVEARGQGVADFGCITCHNDPDCGITNGHGVCDTIRILARAYGLNPEENAA